MEKRIGCGTVEKELWERENDGWMDGSMDWMWKQGLEPLEILNQMAGFETHSESPELSRESATRD